MPNNPSNGFTPEEEERIRIMLTAYEAGKTITDLSTATTFAPATTFMEIIDSITGNNKKLSLDKLMAGSTVEYGNSLTFNANYITDADIKQLRKNGDATSAFFDLIIQPTADIYGETVIICSNVPDLGISGETIALSASVVPAADTASNESAFTAVAYLQGANIVLSVTRSIAGAKLTRIVLTGFHLSMN
ncbi:MAG: hypothetical protein LBV64_00860 [Mediterranea sp.]|jgi:hypothetical protein|nr:hypothetical protein [Mediterranea sp.]